MIYSKIEFIIFIEVVGFVVRIEQLKYFIEIAKCQSIKGASENLFLTQQSLSQTIKNLEKELGFLLLNRTPGGITLTKEGQLFAAFAQKMLDKQQIFWRQIENLQPHIDVKQVGVLTLNVFGLYEVCVLPEILKKYGSIYNRRKLL